ncbi:MAG: hypothetical protein ACI9L6_001054 [Flavobacterium sp.]|jgi:hypothetical protein
MTIYTIFNQKFLKNIIYNIAISIRNGFKKIHFCLLLT